MPTAKPKSARAPAPPDLAIEWWPTDRPKPYDRNPRKITDAAVDKVAASLREFGWRQPIVVDPEGVIIIGHARLMAAVKLKMPKVPVHVAHIDPAKAKALRLADNRTHDEAAWDWKLVTAELTDLKELAVDLIDVAGFSASQMRGMDLQDEGPPARIEQADELLKFWKVKPGQIWTIGPHRLMCGDTTKPDQVAALMSGAGGAPADLLTADPPYGVAYSGGRHRVRAAFQNDPTKIKDYGAFLGTVLASWSPVVSESAVLYLWFGHFQMEATAHAVDAAGWYRRCVIIWGKQHFIFSRAVQHYHQQHEPLLYCSRGPGLPAWYGSNNESTLWTCDRPMASAAHPTQKPLDLYRRIVENSTKPGDLIAEAFLGSGSTMVAAQELGRRCYGMEIEPKYCAVVLDRMAAAASSLKPTLLHPAATTARRARQSVKQ